MKFVFTDHSSISSDFRRPRVHNVAQKSCSDQSFFFVPNGLGAINLRVELWHQIEKAFVNSKLGEFVRILDCCLVEIQEVTINGAILVELAICTLAQSRRPLNF